MSLWESSILFYYLWAKNPAFLSNLRASYAAFSQQFHCPLVRLLKTQPLLVSSLGWEQSLQDKIHHHKRSSVSQLGLIQPWDMGGTWEAELSTCADISPVSPCRWQVTSPNKRASLSVHPIKPSVWKATAKQLPNLFTKGCICQMISLGFFQLGLSSKRWQSEKASVSVWKRGFNLVLHSLPHSVQACTKVFATLGFNCRSPLHHARVCIVLLVYHVPSTLSDLMKIISLFPQITQYTMWSSFPENNLALKMMCYQSLYFFNL